MSHIRERIKWALFPGINLHARLRFRKIGQSLATSGNGVVLDAGCGNGMLGYRSSQAGNSVLGISIKCPEIERNQRLFNQMLGIAEERMHFAVHDLYDIENLGRQFDSIICTEVLEHIADDTAVCQSFWKLLKPGGILHLCCPNRDHPDNRASTLDADENGGHVRCGYTFDSYRALLEPLGFRIQQQIGLGGPIRQACNKRIIRTEERLGFGAAFALFLVCWPLTWFDPSPRVPYSLYVRAVKDN